MIKNENISTEFLKLPASARSGHAIAGVLHTAINRAHGYHVTLAELAAQIGEPPSKTHRWLAATSLPHLRRLTHLIELMSSEERRRFWDEQCRELPTLKHPRLAHDPHGVAQLSALLQKPNGLTWLQGSSHNCSFIMHALGHSFQRTDAAHRCPIGISIHPPESIVPLKNLIYLQPLQTVREQKIAAQHAWAGLRNSNSSLWLLNGMHPSWLPENFIEVARTRKVIFTGELEPALLARTQAKGIMTYAVKVSAPTVVQAPITVRVTRIER